MPRPAGPTVRSTPGAHYLIAKIALFANGVAEHHDQAARFRDDPPPPAHKRAICRFNLSGIGISHLYRCARDTHQRFRDACGLVANWSAT
jgi:hypothetical protein